MDKVLANIKRSQQPSIADYTISSQILQGAIKRKQVQPLYNRQIQSVRKGYDENTLKELSKPYLLKDLKKAWLNYMYSSTLYKKPINKLKKYEIYHELLNVNHNFSTLPKKVSRRIP